MYQPNLNEILSEMRQRDFVVFTSDEMEYNLNIVAVRTPENEINKFNDWLCVFWKFRGVWNFLRFTCTTDPGLYWLGSEKMGNPKGTAMLVEQQVFGMYKWGRHKNYGALEQVRAAKFVRDYNRDGQLNPDLSKVYFDVIKANLHRASQWRHTDEVGAYSAGCVVMANPTEFNLLKHLCQKSADIFGNSFTFSLIDLRMEAQGIEANTLTVIEQ